VYGTTSMEVLKQRQQEMLREAEIDRLKRALRTDRRRRAAPRWASTVAWELTRAAGLIRKVFWAPKSAD
jgi:hypothetical protein